MTITDALLTMGVAHGRSGKSMVPQGVVVHYVANPGSSAMGNRNYFENGSGGAGASAHFVIGLNGEILRCVPETECAAHAGRSFGPTWNEMVKTNNTRFIGIECCHPAEDGKFNDNTIASLTWLAADLCRRFKLDPKKDIYRHYDVCGKMCPVYYVNKPDEWTALRNKFAAAHSQMIGAQTAPPAPAPAAPAAKPAASNTPSSWAADAWAWVKKYNLNDGTRPQDSTTREEVANILYKFYLLISKN